MSVQSDRDLIAEAREFSRRSHAVGASESGRLFTRLAKALSARLPQEDEDERETLEALIQDEARAEAERRFGAGKAPAVSARDCFISGAEWQASRPITDEQVRAAVEHLREYYEVRSSRGNLRWIVPDEEVRAALEAAKGVQ